MAGGSRNIGFDPRVNVYMDGAYIGKVQTLRQPMFDVNRVEVLRGSQGYLFGRKIVAGAVNIITHAPGNELEGYMSGCGGL